MAHSDSVYLINYFMPDDWVRTSQVDVAGVVNHWIAPLSTPFFGDGLDPKLINCVWLQIVNDCVTSWTRLIVPLLVLLTIAHSVVSEQRGKTTWTQQPSTHNIQVISSTDLQIWLCRGIFLKQKRSLRLLGIPSVSLCATGPLLINIKPVVCLMWTFISVICSLSSSWDGCGRSDSPLLKTFLQDVACVGVFERIPPGQQDRWRCYRPNN